MKLRFGLWAQVLLAVVIMVSSGCRGRRGGAGPVGGVHDVEGIHGVDMAGDYWMGDTRFEGEEVRGQFDVVHFDYDSSMVKASERAKVERVAEAMRRDPGMRVVIEGHCDERGSAEYNLALGERRALAVRDYLIRLGVDAARLQTKSYGEEKPVAFGTNEDAWRQNRRGEFVIIR